MLFRSLVVQGGAAIQNSAGVTTASAGTFALASSETIGSFAGSGALQLGSGTILTTGGNNASTTFSGSSSGAGGLTKSGSGVFQLTGANAFSGPLSVAAGNLSIVAGGSLSGIELTRRELHSMRAWQQQQAAVRCCCAGCRGDARVRPGTAPVAAW